MIQSITRFVEMLAHLPYFPRTPEIAPPEYAKSGDWLTMLSERYNVEGMRVLEIGSRVVTGANYRSRFDKAEYIGFDIYEGPNVDLVGDIHRLTSYFEEGDRFDLIFSQAVFEHLYAPWLAAEEISKLLRVGGQVFVITHFSWRSHE
ncbi:MAG: class I SAM-dependent methyltransferase, partial [Pseudomonadota bacterium]